MILYNRAYTEGRCELLQNDKGKAVMRYRLRESAFRNSLTSNLPPGPMFLCLDNEYSREEDQTRAIRGCPAPCSNRA